MIDLFLQHPCTHVRDAGDSEHPGLEMPERDHLRGRGHAGHVRTEDTEHVDLRRGFVLRARHHGVDTFAHPAVVPVVFGHVDVRPLCEIAQVGIVRFRHVDEAIADFRVVQAAQRRLPVQVQVILDDHQLPRPVVRVDGAGSAGEDEGLRTREAGRPHTEHRVLQVVSFVVMGTAGEDEDALRADLRVVQLADVADRTGFRESDVAVVDGDLVLDLVSEGAEARAEHEPDIDFSLADPIENFFGDQTDALFFEVPEHGHSFLLGLWLLIRCGEQAGGMVAGSVYFFKYSEIIFYK